MKPGQRLKEIESMNAITTDEIMSDFNSLPADISKVEWSFYRDTQWLIARVKRLELECRKAMTDLGTSSFAYHTLRKALEDEHWLDAPRHDLFTSHRSSCPYCFKRLRGLELPKLKVVLRLHDRDGFEVREVLDEADPRREINKRDASPSNSDLQNQPETP